MYRVKTEKHLEIRPESVLIKTLLFYAICFGNEMPLFLSVSLFEVKPKVGVV